MSEFECQADAAETGEAVSPSALQATDNAEADRIRILKLERQLRSLHLQIAELSEGNDEKLMLARLKADASVEEMDRGQLLQTIAKLEAKYRFADLDGCITSYLRKAAKETFAGNCTFADDDLKLLEVCARWALQNGIPDDLCPNIFPKAKAALAERQLEEPSGDEALLSNGGQPDTKKSEILP